MQDIEIVIPSMQDTLHPDLAKALQSQICQPAVVHFVHLAGPMKNLKSFLRSDGRVRASPSIPALTRKAGPVRGEILKRCSTGNNSGAAARVFIA